MQTSLFHSELDLFTKESWFQQLVSAWGIQEEPGWPDHLGAAMYSWVMKHKQRPIKTLSLFSGGGGLDIAFHDAGFDIVEMVEVNATYTDTLKLNSGDSNYLGNTKVNCIDIREYIPSLDEKIEFIIGGPPCQTFSAAGRRAAGVQGTDDPRGTLFEEYVRILKILEPKGFLFENVYGITGAQGGSAWKDIKRAFEGVGYHIYYRVLDAADYGVPQHRERLFIVGLKTGSFKFPRPTHGPDSIDKRPHYSAGRAVQGLPDEETREGLGGRFGNLLNDIPPGLNYSFYTQEMGHPRPVFGWRSKFSDFLYKADPDVPVRTIKAQGGQYTGPFSWNNRVFTISELKRLQTFPDSYSFSSKRVSCIEQIGNSVPPQIGRILALSILDQVFDVKLPFEIDYLSDHEQLTFRQRKRLLTKSYATKADEAIKRLYLSTTDQDRPHTDLTATYERYLAENFDWKSHGSSTEKILLTTHICKDKIHIKTMESMEPDKYAIRIQPNGLEGWLLPQKEIQLQANTWNERIFTALWKCLEELISEHYGIADLVQLNGYYQYVPKFYAYIETHEVPTKCIWNILMQVVAGNLVAKMITPDDIQTAWQIPIGEVLPALRGLRVLGYEVRSHNTNPQIPANTYIIPYAFPTLNPRSVQLNKRLESME